MIFGRGGINTTFCLVIFILLVCILCSCHEGNSCGAAAPRCGDIV